MFARAKDTIRILTYRDPVVHGPDAVIVAKGKDAPSKAGKAIALFIEGIVVLFSVGFLAGQLGDMLARFHPTKAVSIGTIVGALGAVLFWMSHQLYIQMQSLLKKRLDLAEKLAPYFGHKLEETYRVLRG